MIHDAGTDIVTVIGVLIVPAFISLGLRCYVRWSRKSWGTDDTYMALSGPFFAFMCGACIAGALNGLGSKDEHLHGGGGNTSPQKTRALLNFFLFQMSYVATTVLIKLSIAAQQIRIASSRPGYAWLLRVLLGVYCATIAGAGAYVLAQCKPLAYTWDKAIPGGECRNPAIVLKISFAVLALNIVTDWTCALLPVPLLWHVQMNASAKAAAGALLSLGVFASVCALVRLKHVSGLVATENYLFRIGPIVVWAFAEAGVGMVAANLSTLRPLVARILAFGSSFTRRADGTYDGSGSGDGGGKRVSMWRGNGRRGGRAGAIELGDSKNGYVETTVESGSIRSARRADSTASVDDDESAKNILPGTSRALGGIRVTHDVEFERSSIV